MRFGLELTFIPIKGKPYRSRCAAEKVANTFNKLFPKVIKDFYKIKAKPDILSLQKIEYCVEVECQVEISYISDIDKYGGVFNIIFAASKALNLTSRIIKENPNEVLYYPTGGGHLHVGLEEICGSSTSTLKILKLETALLDIFLKNPFIYSMFQEPFDDKNCFPFDYHRFADIVDKNDEGFTESLKKEFFNYNYIFQPRYTTNKKTSYPTFEFRLFSSQNNAEELKSDIVFLCSLIRYARLSDKPSLSYQDYLADIKRLWAYKKKLKEIKFAKREVRKFFERINCPWCNEYEKKFERNYVVRKEFGNLDLVS